MRCTTKTLAAALVLLASFSQTQAGDMTDKQILKRAVEVIAKEDANAKVTPVQSKNLHLEPWALKNQAIHGGISSYVLTSWPTPSFSLPPPVSELWKDEGLRLGFVRFSVWWVCAAELS